MGITFCKPAYTPGPDPEGALWAVSSGPEFQQKLNNYDKKASAATMKATTMKATTTNNNRNRNGNGNRNGIHYGNRRSNGTRIFLPSLNAII